MSTTDRKTLRRRERKAKARLAAYEQRINSNPIFVYAKQLSESVAQEYGIPANIFFKNMTRKSYAQLKFYGDEREYNVYYGYQNLQGFAEEGYPEYPSLQPMVNRLLGLEPGTILKGLAAIHLVVLHEMAHLLCYYIWDKEQDHHGPRFQEAYAALIRVFPYEA